MSEFQISAEVAGDTLLCLMGLAEPVEGSPQLRLWGAVAEAFEAAPEASVLNVSVAEGDVVGAMVSCSGAFLRGEGDGVARKLFPDVIRAWLAGEADHFWLMN